MLSEAKESSNEDRLHYLFLNLIGQVVTVYIEDGTVLEGLFISVDDNKEHMLLAKSRFCTSLVHSCDDEAKVRDKVVVKMDSIVMVDVNDASFRGSGPNRGVNDPLRSGGPQVMQRWADFDEEEGEDLEGGKDGKDWDQFEENKKRFGTKSTWDENLYTTKLNPTEFSAEQKARAAKLAREIETGQAHGGIQHRIERGEDVGEDDATLYSDVQGDRPKPKSLGGGSAGAYVPPGKRPAGAAAGPPAAVGDLDDRAQRMAGTQPGKRTDPADAAPPALGASGPDAGPGSKPGFNAAAKEWKPSAGPAQDETPVIITNMLQEMAKALQSSGLAKSCSPDWPGDDLYYDEEQNDGNMGMGPMGGMGGAMGGGGPGMNNNMGGGPGGMPRGNNNFGGPQGNMGGGNMGGGHGNMGGPGNFGGGNMGGGPGGMGGPGAMGGPNNFGGNPNNMGGGHGGPNNFGGHGGPGPSGPGGNYGGGNGGGGNFGGGNMGGGHSMGGPGGNYGGNQGGHHQGGPGPSGPGNYGGNQGGNFPAHGGNMGGGGMDRGGPGNFGNHGHPQHNMGGGPGPSGGYGRDQGGNMGGPQGMGRGGPQHMDPNGPGPSGFGGPGPQGGPQGGGMPGRGGMQGRGGGGRGMGGQPHQPLPSMGGQGGPSAPSAIDTPQQGGERSGGGMRGRGGGPMQGRGGGGGNEPRGPLGSQPEVRGKGKR